MSTSVFAGKYLSERSIDNLIITMRLLYPAVCHPITLESSREGRPIRAIKLGKGSSPSRRGVLLVGGIHARELLNPDSLIYFAFLLAFAYKYNRDLVLGGRTYSSWWVKMLIENLDVFILPLANPDGRAYVLAPNGDRMWRGNRAPNTGGLDCDGNGQAEAAIAVDINRNFDFLWSSSLHASSNPCNLAQIYKGPAAFSEPETRNIRKLLDSYPHIAAMIDVHSYSEYIIHPWSDDENQTTNTSMRFSNPAYDGQRGTKGDAYKEYIRGKDLQWFVATANRMDQAIASVRGRDYLVIPGVDVYSSGISGASNDYSYSRHLVDAAKRKVLAFAMETGPEVRRSDGSIDYLASFQPPFPEAGHIMQEIQAAFMELCITIFCGASELFEAILAAAYSAQATGTAGKPARPSPTGTKFAKFLEKNRDELLDLAHADRRLMRQTLVALKRVLPIIQSYQSPRPKVFDKALIQRVDAVLGRFEELGSRKLRGAIQGIRTDLPAFAGKTMVEGLRARDKSQRRK
jgi:murein tripeptide amidase MpaA